MSSPAMTWTRRSAMSIAEDTPAAVTIFLDDSLERGLGAELAQLTKEKPMRSRAQPLEHAGRSEQQSPGAYRRGPARRLVRLLDPGDQLVVRLVARALSAWDQDDVRLRNVAQSVLGGQRQRPRIGGLRARLSGNEKNFRSGHAAQHLVRANGV
jgi:hypothetical protein